MQLINVLSTLAFAATALALPIADAVTEELPLPPSPSFSGELGGDPDANKPRPPLPPSPGPMIDPHLEEPPSTLPAFPGIPVIAPPSDEPGSSTYPDVPGLTLPTTLPGIPVVDPQVKESSLPPLPPLPVYPGIPGFPVVADPRVDEPPRPRRAPFDVIICEDPGGFYCQEFKLRSGQCQNMDYKHNDKASSLRWDYYGKPHGDYYEPRCTMFVDANCQGFSVRTYENHPGNIPTGLNDKLTAILCED